MCRILVKHSNDGDINIVDLNQLLSLSENRGPDSTKSILIDNNWMGFNRLLIQGLTKISNQPMVEEKEEY